MLLGQVTAYGRTGFYRLAVDVSYLKHNTYTSLMNISDDERRKREKFVISQEDGIFPMYEAFYIEAILYSAGRAMDAFQRFDKAVRESAVAADIVATAHEALTHIAGLSRFFWPARDKDLHNARARKLREAFQLDDKSALYDRQLRNALEHFDERLDEFLLQDLAGHFYPSPIVGSLSMEGPTDTMFRMVDPEKEIFALLGQKYSFGYLRSAVDDIYSKAQAMEGSGSILRRDSQ